MLNRSRIIRRVVIVVAVLLASGAAAAMKLTSWTPANMCFCPTPDRPDSAVKSESGAEVILPSGSLRVPLDTNTTAHGSSGALAAAPIVELAEKSHGNGNAVGKPSWAPWGKNANRRYASASSGSGPSASLGSLWKMMSLSGRSHSTEQHASARISASPSPRAANPKPSPSPKPSKPPVSAPTPPSGAVSSAPVTSVVEVGTVAMALPPAGSAFREDAIPVAELVAGPLPIPALHGNLGASLGRGNSANAHAGPSSNLAATPEPGSFALIATGLLGIAGLLRRKRV